MTTISNTDRPAQDRFEHELCEVVLRVRGALAGILELVDGYGPHVKVVCDAMGVHRKLGWQISKVACETDPFVAARYMPTPGGMNTFLRAAARRDVPEEQRRKAEEAFAEFERVVTVHADDRSTLEMMLGAWPAHADDASQLAARKMAFSGNSMLFGVQARAYMVSAFVHPSEKEGWFDTARLHCHIGFRRNRPNLSWVISRTHVADDDYRQRSGAVRECLAPPADDDDARAVPLLPEFCSQPLPQLRRRIDSAGWMLDELVEGPVGNTAALTMVTGELTRQTAPAFQTEHSEQMDWGAWVTMPCEVLIFDQFIHRDVFPPSPRQVRVFANLMDPAHFGDGLLLPISEQVVTPGRGLQVIHTPEVPRYAEMAKHVFDRLGWDAQQFELYRLRIQYPPMPTAVVVSHALHPTPE